MKNKPSSSSAQVGVLLATQVACKLETGAILAYQHRDYCGIGLRYVDQAYVCGEVFDGALPSPTQVKAWQAGAAVEWMAFDSRAAFVAWLAQQCDDSLSGRDLPQAFAHDNQRLTMERLKKFVTGQGE